MRNWIKWRNERMVRPRTKPIDMSGNKFFRTSVYAEKKVIQQLDKLCKDTRESRSFYINRELKNLLKRMGYWTEDLNDE